MCNNPSMEGGDITTEVVSALVGSQFPEWTDLPISAVPLPGWDNITFRLGDELSVRLPRDDSYAPQLAKEHQWLPILARELPVPIPQPVAIGRRSELFPRTWSVYRWLDGEPAATATVDDQITFAHDLGSFLSALRRLEAVDGPPAGSHSFYRGGALATYDDQTRAAVDLLAHGSAGSALIDVWESALASEWPHPPVWVHGDVAPSNLLVDDGSLRAVIDFGCCAVGDPACDLVMAWTYFSGDARESFRKAIDLDSDTWARARGWALWKALITLVDDRRGFCDADAAGGRFGWRFTARQIIDLVAEDHAASDV
jgi:aminoglycoside phosphotransferase (APT) family kinase protein